jgi:hypothetical protein
MYSCQGTVSEMGWLVSLAVSYAQHRDTLRTVYPPPPSTSIGTPKLLMCSMHAACPRMDRFQQPTRSPDSESAPQHSTTADGWKCSITLFMIGTKMLSYAASSMPANSGKLSE